MAKKERMGRMEPPRWWLDEALPRLDAPTTKAIDVAREASIYAKRERPWGPDAIAKFKSGTGRTVELTNGISYALQIPQPFFTAPSRAAAIDMLQITKREQSKLDERTQRLEMYDRAADREFERTPLDGDGAKGVASKDDGKTGRGERAGRVSRGRA